MSTIYTPAGDPLADLLNLAAVMEEVLAERKGSAPNTFEAVYFGLGGDIRVFTLREQDAMSAITMLVGDPFAGLLTPVSGVAFWSGSGANRHSAKFNPTASHVVKSLLDAVTENDYSVSAEDREYCERLTAKTTPLVFGPCVLTGLTDSSAPAAHGEHLRTWFAAYVDRLNLMRMAHAVADTIRESGVPFDSILGLDVRVIQTR